MIAPPPASLVAQDAAPPGAAVIRNSGSTNSAGYTLVVRPDSTAEIMQNGTTSTAAVAEPQVKWLFAKLHEAQVPGALPERGCMKSASFGSSTTIAYEGVTTPDLTCGVTPLARELSRTVAVITQQLGIGTVRRGPPPTAPAAEPGATP